MLEPNICIRKENVLTADVVLTFGEDVAAGIVFVEAVLEAVVIVDAVEIDARDIAVDVVVGGAVVDAASMF